MSQAASLKKNVVERNLTSHPMFILILDPFEFDSALDIVIMWICMDFWRYTRPITSQ